MTRSGGTNELNARIVTGRGDFDVDVSLHVEAGCTAALLGPNGSGKSTVVSAIAGVVPLRAGTVTVGEEVWEQPAQRKRLPPQRRSVGVVFQGLLLFPSLSVVDNVAYGIVAAGESRRRARSDVKELMDELDIVHLADRRPHQLSGGQAQRVALARALATKPRVLLLDEPMSALDIESRAEARRKLRRTLSAFSGAVILVTHDPLEAMSLADRVVIVEHGRVTQEGTQTEITRRPRSPYVASLAGTNFLEGHVVSKNGHWSFENAGGRLSVAAQGAEGHAFAVVHPRAVTLHASPPARSSARNVLSGRVVALELLGDRARVALATSPELVGEVTAEAVDALGLEEGHLAWASIKSTQIEVYPA
jgi:molybdate transport system ATP-binding protein